METAAFETFAECRCRESFAFGSCVALLSSPRVVREAQTVSLLRLRGGGTPGAFSPWENEQAKAATEQMRGDRGGGSGAITRCESRVTMSRCRAEASLPLLRLPSTWVRGARKRGKRGHRDNR